MTGRSDQRPLSLSLLFLIPFLFLGATGSEPSFGPEITLGEFYSECVRAFGIKQPEGWDRSKSWLLLRAAGLEVDWKVDFDQPLRQKHVVHIASQLGIPITSSAQEDLFSRKQVEAFLARYREYFRLPLKRTATPAPGGERPDPDRAPDSPGGSRD